MPIYQHKGCECKPNSHRYSPPLHCNINCDASQNPNGFCECNGFTINDPGQSCSIPLFRLKTKTISRKKKKFTEIRECLKESGESQRSIKCEYDGSPYMNFIDLSCRNQSAEGNTSTHFHYLQFKKNMLVPLTNLTADFYTPKPKKRRTKRATLDLGTDQNITHIISSTSKPKSKSNITLSPVELLSNPVLKNDTNQRENHTMVSLPTSKPTTNVSSSALEVSTRPISLTNFTKSTIPPLGSDDLSNSKNPTFLIVILVLLFFIFIGGCLFVGLRKLFHKESKLQPRIKVMWATVPESTRIRSNVGLFQLRMQESRL